MTTNTDTTASIRLALCVQSAGRSQIATVFAGRERGQRGLDDHVDLLTGGTQPADQIHPDVLEAMDEVGFDLSDRIPREITIADLQSCGYVVTMGCSTLDVRTHVDVHDWALDDPSGQKRDRVREIREEIEARVTALFDELVESRHVSDGTNTIQ